MMEEEAQQSDCKVSADGSQFARDSKHAKDDK